MNHVCSTRVTLPGNHTPASLAACGDVDAEIAGRARTALGQLRNAEGVEALCRQITDADDPIAREIALSAGYLPQDEYQRALFLFLTEQWDAYEALDFDRRLLRTVYGSAEAARRQRIAEKLRALGRTDFLTILAGADFRSRARELSVREGEFLVQMLGDKGEWARLWTLVFELPALCSLPAVRRLAGSGWRPEKEDERAALTELSALASAEIMTAAEELRQVLPPAVQRARVNVAGRVNDAAFSANRPVVAVGTGSRKVVLWNFQRGAVEQEWDGLDHSVGRVAFMPDETLLCAERTNTLSPCAVRGWREGRRFALAEHAASATVLEPVGESLLLTAGRDRRVVLWDLCEMRPLHEQSFSFWARGACIAPDYQRAALLHEGIALVSLPDLGAVGRTSGWYWQGVCRCAAFAPGGGELVAGKFNGEVLVCRRDGEELAPERGMLTAHVGQVRGIGVLSNCSVVITAGSGGEIRFFEWPSRSLIGSVHAPGSRLTSLLTSLRVSPNGAFMAVGDSDTSMSFWDLRVLELPGLFARPLARALPAHLPAVSAVAQDEGLAAPVRNGMRFLQCLLQHRFRYDIEVDELPTIRVGEFDIEIE